MIVDPLGLVLVLATLGLVLYFFFATFAFGAGYQPTPREVVDRMLDLAEVGPTDVVYDLGAGTGAFVFRAARDRGARAVGVEIEPLRIAVLRLRRRFGPARDRITIRWGNLFGLDYRESTVVVLFLWGAIMGRLKPRLEAELPKGARVVSYWHPVPGWEPTHLDPEHRIFLYRR